MGTAAADALARLGKPTKPLRERVTLAFREMRKHGIFARQSYSCCQSCGMSEASQDIKKRQAQGKTVTGLCFYHMQDTPEWDELWVRQNDTRVLLAVVEARETGVLKRITGDRWELDYPEREALEAKCWQELCRVIGSEEQARKLGLSEISHAVANYMTSYTSHLREELDRAWSEGIYLAYDTAGDDDDERTAAKALGQVIVGCLKRCGVAATWDGNPRRRVCIPLMQDAISKPKKRYRRRKVA